MTYTTRFILVNYNSGEWLQRAVESVLEFSDGQITVVDNASQDQSFSAAQTALGDHRITWMANSENVGFAAANNQALSVLKEDIAVLMNPDCLINGQTMQPILAALAEHPNAGAASCRILNQDGSNQVTSRRHFPTPLSALARMAQLHRLPNPPEWAKNFDFGGNAHKHEPMSLVPAISGAFMVIRKSTLDTVGLLDEGYFMHCEDLDWCKRCELAGIDIAYVSESSVVHAKGISSKSRPIGVLWNLHTGMIRFFNKHYRKQYGFFITGLTKLGIYVSFVMRVALGLLRSGLIKILTAAKSKSS
jgi:GT2 family glycosyltransferase